MPLKILDLSLYRSIDSDDIAAEIRGLLEVFKASRKLRVQILPEEELRARIDAMVAVTAARHEGLDTASVFGGPA